MRVLPIFYTLFASSVIAQSSGNKVEKKEVTADAEDAADGPAPTIFNGVEVPPITILDGETFNATVKEGLWFVKHHSPYCPHCLHVAPTWQTLYEFYYTSKPVAAGPSADSSSSSLNTFTAYYNFHFGNLDCIAFGTACKEHNVGSFPTFVLYKDGVEVKRLEGAKDMKTLSQFVESSLDSIRPGSRPVGDPELPAAGDKTSKEYQGPQPADAKATGPVGAAPVATSPVKATASSASEDLKEEETKAPSTTVKTNPAKVPKKPVLPPKSTAIPNTLGKSISFTAESFQKQVTMTQEPWFIKFYAPWCHHCQAMAPNWIQLAKEMKGKLNIGEVNCDVEARLCKEVRLRGYPTILFFRGGERVEYEGLRGLGDFVSYANKAIDVGDGVKDIDALEFAELEEKEEVIFLYFYDHATTTEDFAALERLTLSLIGHAKLVKTNSAKLAERYKITTWPRLLVSRDGRPTYYTALAPKDMRDFRQVLNWMQSVWLPIVPELTASNSREIMDGKLVVLGILTRERPDEFLMAKKEIKSAALEWMDKQTLAFQRERQELRDAKQLRLEEAEDRNDQRALRAAKSIRINMDKSEQKEVGFAWVDGVFWERWIRTTYGIEVAKDGEKVIINDEDQRRYWDTTITGNSIMASRTSILETIPKVVASPPKIKPKSTISNFEKFFFDIRGAISGHPYLSVGFLAGILIGVAMWSKGRMRRSRGGFFRLDEKDGLLGGPANGKVD
ncbi:thioredoxin-like protein [Cadophora sp. MPI-SDFR-AT-0126]|nr:thioredoxin-like protein [Leotiomycetes sp. MPI-SDFR-AT-0126]